MEKDISKNTDNDVWNDLFNINEEEEFVSNYIKKQCDYYSQKAIAIFDILQTYIKKVYGIDTEISTNDINKFAEDLLSKLARNTPDHYISKKHLGIIRKEIKKTFYLEVKEYIVEYEKKSVLVFRNKVIDKSNQKIELQNYLQLLYEVKNVRNTRELFSDYEIEVNKLLPDSKEFLQSEEEYYFSVHLYNLNYLLNQFVNNILNTLETKLNSDIEFLQRTEALPPEPQKTPKEYKYFIKKNGKYKYTYPNKKYFAYCLNLIGNNSGEGIVTNIKNAKIFDFLDSNYNSMKTYIKTNDYGKADEAIADDLMQELKQILKEAKII